MEIKEKLQLELSTRILIEEAENRGHQVEIMDPVENFIRIKGKERIEYIKQATRTSADNYIAPLIMENKSLTKKILTEAGIHVPNGKVYFQKDAGLEDYDYWKNKDLVIKPNSTNFGTAVHTLFSGFSFQQYSNALEDAFHQDTQVLAETFTSGKEYRILVIGDEVNAVLHRIPANVIGDGVSTIRFLVEDKNRHPLRGEGYVKPLERIKLTNREADFLTTQELSFDSIPEMGRQVFLRKNSNISTGGDSLDKTDQMHDSYKAVALEATRAIGARISGVDMLVDDIHLPASPTNHAIIELNFNPAIHIHTFPLEGQNRKPAADILDLLRL